MLSHSARREFIDVAAAYIRHKQIARAVKGQPLGKSNPEAKVLALRPA